MLKFTHLFLLLVSATSLVAQQGDDDLPTRDSIFEYAADREISNTLGEYNAAYYQVDELNPGLAPRPDGMSLRTPQATLELFIKQARKNNYGLAAQALNLNLLPADLQKSEAATLAEKLHYVIRQRVPISWGDLPDRPDGQTNRSTTQEAIAGEPRRTINFGSLDVDGRKVTLSLQRLRVKETPPVWVISAETTENIEALYTAYGPTWLNRVMPEWAEQRVLGVKVWKLVGLVVFALLCYLAALLIYRFVAWLVGQSDAEWVNDLGDKMATPISLAGGSLLFYIVMNDLLKIAGGWSPYLYSLLLAVVILSLTWLIMRVIDYAIERIRDLKVADVSDEDNLESRRLLTYISVGRWVLTTIVVMVGISVIVGQFPQLRNLGVSLIASAGIATVVLGIAAQSTLGNVVAGLQIAITKPARIGDSIITSNGEYGTVEDIRFTYLVVKTWEARRLVIPLKYFIDHPFQNWSMNDPHMLKPIVLYADFGVDVERIREKFIGLCKANEHYDGESEPSVQVVGSDKEALKIRCLTSAKDAPSAWTLHVELREAMVKWLAGLDGGGNLARERVQVISEGEQ
ncbi:mechanosensitive ion channel family protein [Neolewinella antarctica]|uniref:Small-conductance mechanosensitive channel n=1 Tax=Neolewinella antarctica TaxID=442734 RepID=A0ABX0XHP5_9BACT|nr:mechanosensitive ion channel family protein [Neolewinella antarctica]NJC28363.1 small-conductance mechanosensitive channel [Neolewinella antarctica]